MRVVFAPEADAQLIDLYGFIAREASPEIARRFADDIVGYCEGFSTFPNRGTKRDDLRAGLRTIGFRRRVTIAFRVADEAVVIAGIFYGGQDVEAFFTEP